MDLTLPAPVLILISGLWGISLFFIKKWINDLEKKIDSKVDSSRCVLAHDNIDKCLHTHAKVGSAGEVVQL